MKTRSKLLLSSITVFIGLAAISIYFIQSFMQPANLKNLLQQQFLSYTGRQLTISGDIKWHLFPWIGLQLTDVEISQFSKIQELDISLKLQPLLQGYYEVGKVRISGCQLNLVKDTQGNTNWAFKPTDSKPTQAVQNKFQFHVKRINVDNADITFTDRQNNQYWRFSKFNLSASDVDQTSYFPLQVSFSLLNNTKQAIKVKSKALLKMNLAEQKINIKQIDTTVGETRLKGTVDYLLQPSPELEFNLMADRINTALYTNFLAEKSSKTNQVRTQNNNTATDDTLLKGTFYLGQLQHNDVLIKDITLNPQLQHGVFNITQLTAKLYQGSLKARIYGNFTAATPRWKTDLDLQNINLAELLRNQQNKKSLQLRGVLTLASSLTVHGWQTSQFMSSLQGNVRGEITRGEIRGLNIQKQLNLATTLINNKQQTTPTQQGVDTFSKLVGTMQIVNGIGTTRDLVLLSPITQITSLGYFNFINNSFDFTIKSKLAAQKNSRLDSLQNYLGGNIPLRLVGDVNHYKIYPDTKGVLKAHTEQILKQKLQDLLSFH